MLHRRWLVSLFFVTIALVFALADGNPLRAAPPSGAGSPNADPLIPAAELLNSDGTFNTSGGRSGGVNLTGWNVSLDPRRGPVLTRSGSGQAHPAMTVGAWSPMGDGASSTVYAVAVNGNFVYVGGDFTQTCGTLACYYVAQWDGVNWSPLGLGFEGSPGADYPGVRALLVKGGRLYAGGSLLNACDSGGCNTRVNNIAQWNGSAWLPVGNGFDNTVFALAAGGNVLYAAGGLNIICGDADCKSGNTNVNYIAQWNGSSWSAVGNGTDYIVNALAWNGSTLYAGGTFTQVCGDPTCTNGNTTANYVAQWNGSSWSAAGNGLDDWVYALAVNGSTLYAGGRFLNKCGDPACNLANETRVNYVAQWNGSDWSPIGFGLDSPPGTDFPGVNALLFYGGTLYAGGDISQTCGDQVCTADPTRTVHNVVQWDGANWSGVGNGLDGIVDALGADTSFLYAGGEFTNICGNQDCSSGNTPANHIAEYGLPAIATPTPTATATRTPTPAAGGNGDLQLGKTSQLISDTAGRFVYWLTVTNPGKTPIKKVYVFDHLPKQVKFLNFVYAGRVPGWQCSYNAQGRSVTCYLMPDLAPRSSARVGILVQAIDRRAPFTNCATAFAATVDPFKGNNVSCLTLNQNLKPVPNPPPKPTLTATSMPTTTQTPVPTVTPTATPAPQAQANPPDTGTSDWLESLWNALVGWAAPARTVAQIR